MKKDYLHYKVQLIKRNNGEGTNILPKIKKYFGYKNYRNAILTIRNNQNYKDYFMRELFPSSINCIITPDCIPLSFNQSEITESNIINEIKCFIAFFSCFNEQLKEYYLLRKEFENNFFCGRYDLSNNILKKIKDITGYSFWYIESKMLIAQFYMNRIENNAWYEKIKTECDDFFVKRLIRVLWRKTNIHENYKESYDFITNKIKEISTSQIPEHLKNLFIYQCFNTEADSLTLHKIYNLLLSATNLNIIDMYLIIEFLIVEVLSSTIFHLNSKQEIIKTISEFDFCFIGKKTCDLINKKCDEQDDITHKIYFFNKMLFENPQKYESLSFDELCTFSCSFGVILLCAKFEILIGDKKDYNNTLFQTILSTIKSMLLKNCDYNDFIKTQETAKRLLLILDSTTMKYSYLSFFYDVLNIESSYKTKMVITCEYYNYQALYYFNEFSFEDRFRSIFGNWESYWGNNTYQLNEKCYYDKVTKDIVNIKNLDKTNDLSISYNINSIYTGIQSVLSSKYFEKKFYNYLKTKEIDKAIQLYVDLQFKSKLIASSLDCSMINRCCNGYVLRSMRKSIDFCIYAHLTNFRGGEGLRFNRQVSRSVLAILKSKKIGFPSQLEISTSFSSLQKDKVLYFFRHICETELLASVLTGYSITSENPKERFEKALLERKKLLTISLDFEHSKHEKDEIKSQIDQVNSELLSLNESDLEIYMVSSAKIFENAIQVSDSDIIFPFYRILKEIKDNGETSRLKEYKSGEYLLFKSYFIKYKKAYINSLDQKIGVYIRHGYFKDEIIEFFAYNGLAYKLIDLNSLYTEDSKNNFELINQNKIHFSKELYEFIENALSEIKVISSSSSENLDKTKVYINDETIARIGNKTINVDNPYQFKKILNYEMSLILDEKLNEIGDFIQKKVYSTCICLISKHYKKLLNTDDCLEKSILELSTNIKNWFKFIRGGKELCYFDKYCNGIEEKNNNVHCHISDDFPNKISLNKLHYIDLIISNLLMNAKEHSGLNNDNLLVSLSFSIENKSIKIYFSNNLSDSINAESLLYTIDKLERLMKRHEDIVEKKKGKGFLYIKKELDSLDDVKWNMSFIKDKIPKFFSLYYLIEWSDSIV